MEPDIVEDTQLEAGYNDAPAATPEPTKPPELSESTKVLLERFDRLESRTRNVEGHIGGLNHQQKQLQETLAASTRAAANVSDAPTQTQVREAMANPAEWEALKGDFPEWATATEKFLDARISQIKPAQAVNPEELKRVQDEIKAFDRKLDEARYEDALDALNVAFEGWREETQTPKFKEWQKAQPPEIQALGDSRRFSDAAKMLRLYEKSKVVPEPVYINPRQRRLQAAVNPRGAGGNDSARRTEFDDMEAGYNS